MVHYRYCNLTHDLQDGQHCNRDIDQRHTLIEYVVRYLRHSTKYCLWAVLSGESAFAVALVGRIAAMTSIVVTGLYANQMAISALHQAEFHVRFQSDGEVIEVMP